MRGPRRGAERGAAGGGRSGGGEHDEMGGRVGGTIGDDLLGVCDFVYPEAGTTSTVPGGWTVRDSKRVEDGICNSPARAQGTPANDHRRS